MKINPVARNQKPSFGMALTVDSSVGKLSRATMTKLEELAVPRDLFVTSPLFDTSHIELTANPLFQPVTTGRFRGLRNIIAFLRQPLVTESAMVAQPDMTKAPIPVVNIMFMPNMSNDLGISFPSPVVFFQPTKPLSQIEAEGNILRAAEIASGKLEEQAAT